MIVKELTSQSFGMSHWQRKQLSLYDTGKHPSLHSTGVLLQGGSRPERSDETRLALRNYQGVVTSDCEGWCRLTDPGPSATQVDMEIAIYGLILCPTVPRGPPFNFVMGLSGIREKKSRTTPTSTSNFVQFQLICATRWEKQDSECKIYNKKAHQLMGWSHLCQLFHFDTICWTRVY